MSGHLCHAATVLVVDDDASVRKALARLFQSAGWQAETFASAREFLDHVAPASPSCLVLDVWMPGLSGLDLQAEMTSRHLHTPIIFITGNGNVPMSVQAMKAGAVDFLIKPFKDEELLWVVQEAIQEDARLQAARAVKAEIQSRLQTLTGREHEVLHLVVKGRMNKEIADALGVTEPTVKVHRGRVMQKMQVPSVAELVQTVALVRAGRSDRRTAGD
ncbi:MAG TPA: response regulator [Verrucomicrobiae bacterium]